MNNKDYIRMNTKSNDKVLPGQTLIAHEGFLNSKYGPLLEDPNVHILKMRFLADGPVFHVVPGRMIEDQ